MVLYKFNIAISSFILFYDVSRNYRSQGAMMQEKIVNAERELGEAKTCATKAEK